MPNICVNCVKDNHLKELVKRDGSTGVCLLCDENNLVLNTETNIFLQLSKALVRFYYSEWDYNHHWGGDGYESLFEGPDNPFFDIERSISKEAYEEVVMSITDAPVYEDYDKGVSVFAGHGPNGEQNMLLQSLASDLDQGLLHMSVRLKTENHYSLEDDMKAILQRYRKVAAAQLEGGEFLYRARVGVADKKRNFTMGFETELHYEPYTGEDIAAPPPYKAGAGRANRGGVSFLYCATDKETAVAEIRPHPGDHVSIAKLSLDSEVTVYDLSESKLINFVESDKLLDSYKPFNTLGVLLNKTIPPSDREQYSITQLIADCIRQLDFDGIRFTSTVGAGKNVVLFDQKRVSEFLGGAEVVLIRSVEYSYDSEPTISDEEVYS